VAQAITAAGGVSAAGDGTKVVVTRRDGWSDEAGEVGAAQGGSGATLAFEIDVDAILAGGAAGLELADGDTVYVPELAGQVVVLGEVARPGAYKLPRGAKLADAVAAAGGLTARASLENVTIYAGGDASAGAGAAIGQGKALFAGDGAANPTLGASDVVVVGCRMINVTLAGAVSHPGVYELATGARLLDAVAAAGGVSTLGDAKHVVLTRGSGERASGADFGSGQTGAGIDLDVLGHDPGSQGNAVLADGDVIYIPEAPEKLKRQAAVLGAVARPGVYPVDEGTRLMEAIAAAGGPLDAADLSRVKVYRGGEPAGGVDLEVVDDRLIYDGDIKANPVVGASSVIVVPGTEVCVYVAGFVARPGQVTLRRGATALDAIAAAGGVTSSGDGTRVALARKTGEGAFSLELDVTSALGAWELQGEASGKPPVAPMPLLEDGDALFVPEAVPGQVVVLGEVARPGAYKLQRGAKLLDAIAAAGGATARASLDNVTVYAAGQADQAGKRAIGEGRVLFGGSAQDNPELSPGDMVVVGSRAMYVSVVGRVARPGAYELLAGARVVDAIAAAGGLASGADAGSVVHSRRGFEPGSATLDVDALLRDPNLGANALLADGDALFVPEAREQVAIMGEVARPGVYPAGRGATLMDVLAAAGGPTGKADLARVKIYEGRGGNTALDAEAGGADSRPGGLTALSLAVADESLAYEGNIKANPPIKAGQVIVVPSAGIRVQVAGHVQRPGSYELKRGADVAQAITAAGGVSAAGDGTKVVVTRRDGWSDEAGEVGTAQGGSVDARAFEIDVDAVLAGGAAGLELADGDTVYVPELAGQVVVLGEVARPGSYRLPRGAKLADAVAAAGGLTARASLENVTIYAGGDTSVGAGAAIGRGKALFAGDGAANPTLGASDVVVVGSRMINVTLAGAASRPGVYELATGARLLDAVAAAGGVSALGDAKHVVLTRGPGGRASGAGFGSGQTAAGIDLDVLARDPGSQGNAVLADGDVIYIPEAPEKLKKQAAVLGAVARPGVYPVDDGTRLMEAIAAAGGPLDAADLSRVKVYRGGEPAEGVDLEVADDRLIYDGDIKANPVVEASSVIVVPGTEVRVYVAGFVARPGQVALRRGATALDAIAAAGGVTSSGDGTRVALARKTGDGAFSLELDVTSALDARELQGEASGKPLAKAPTAPLPMLEDGDALFVPEAVPGQVLVLGQVARPGSYRLTKGARVLDMIAAAGGVTPKASLEKISIFSEGILAGPRYVSIGTGKSLLPEGSVDNPEIRAGDVIVVASRMITVNVIGAVARPGTFEIQPGASLVDAVAAAGGTRADADVARVSVARRPAQGATKSEVLTLDLEAAIGGADAETPVLMADGDVIFVPEAQGQVLVLGEVARPGAYKLAREARLLDAIAAAGGTTAKASLESVTIYKDGALAAGAAEPLGHGKVLFSGKVTENPRVSPGDVVTVGSRMIGVSVIGRAARPGSYELPAGSRVIDAVAAAGGVAADADRRSVLVIPAGKSGPSVTVDLDQALRTGDVGHILSDGDVVFIPDTRRQVAVMGEVAQPGVYAYTEGMTLMEVMAMAGGPSAKADLDRVRLYRGERVEDALRLEVADDRLAFEGDIKRNPALAPGDILFVPSGRIRVQVAGHIARTGEVELRRGATILDAISAAGGLAQAGDGARVVVTRRGEGVGRVFEVDVDGLLRGGIPQAEAAGLEDGDVVFVPEANRKIAVMGGVARPGLYDYKTGMKLIEGLAIAGGPTAAARLDRVMVYSGDQAVEIALGDAKAQAMTIDPTRGNNPELKSGDIIIVPLSEKIDWTMIISILSAINQIKGIITR
jgi:protein involved in polysaccharide export with SLBB domain